MGILLAVVIWFAYGWFLKGWFCDFRRPTRVIIGWSYTLVVASIWLLLFAGAVSFSAVFGADVTADLIALLSIYGTLVLAAIVHFVYALRNPVYERQARRAAKRLHKRGVL